MIIYFTGTGNSRLVALGLAERMADEAVEMGHEPRGRLDRVVWVFPIYSWGVPPVVRRYMESAVLPAESSARHYMVCTCGDDVGNAHRQWRRIMKRRRWHAHSAFSVMMPNTYTLMKGFDVDPVAVAESKLGMMPGRLDDIVRRINSGRECDDVVRGSWAWVKTAVIYPWFVRYAMSPKPFHADDRCTGCGLCVRKCPVGNMTMGSDRRPVWGPDCALCLRCYHICPHHAVQYGKATLGKGQSLTLNS